MSLRFVTLYCLEIDLFKTWSNHQHINHQPSTPNTLFLSITRDLLAHAPFFAHLLVRIPKRADTQLSLPFVIAWENQPVLYYQPRLLNVLKDQQEWLAAWLCEELLHLLLQHPQQAAKYPITWAFHLAADLEVRQYLPIPYCDDLFQALYTRLHLNEFADLTTIYTALLRLQATQKATEILPQWHATLYSQKSHFSWPSVETLLTWPSWWSTQDSLLAELGENPAALHLQNRLTSTPSKVSLPWTTVLRRFISSAQRTQNRNSLRRPSRRFGTLPGMRRRRTTRLAVVLDTSGSIQPIQRIQFFREIQNLQKLTHEIHLIEADYQVRASYLFNGTIPTMSTGGGRTSFDPALEAINTLGPFDGVIYFTDGQASLPKIKCLSPLLWIICNTTPPSLSPNWPGQITHYPTM
ncbi:VWA-like domain-containing protein [Lewinella sp. LCG006]|uniref:VWA-like domain-containing protein n=1 Tax=Lewinella sp. LCG006 TaxID=3231911 RepID=UPI0034611AA4